ncbi:MAG: hypothetical protein P8Y53_21520, partial [Pseudolabrys sp.]
MATASDKLRADMETALSNVRAELERIEILAAALDACSLPVPDYEPAFRHLILRELDRFELPA